MKWLGWSLVGIGSAGVLASLYWISRGNVETRGHILNRPGGWVEADPEALARLAGVSRDVYALASIMQSEESTEAGRLAIGWATRNNATAAKKSIFTYATDAILSDGRKGPSHGHFGSQESEGKKAASSKAPTSGTLALAAKILAGTVADVTQGSTLWFAPELQDRKHKENPKKYTKDAAGVIAARKAAGYRPVNVSGVPKTVFFTKAKA